MLSAMGARNISKKMDRYMKFYKKFIGYYPHLLLLIPIISGCQSAPYQEPKSGPLTTIKFINASQHPMSVQVYEDAAQCTNRHKVGDVVYGAPKIVNVQAGKKMAFTAVIQDAGMGADNQKALVALGGAVGAAIAATAATSGSNSCLPTIDFVPKEGTKYILKLSVDGANCKFDFTEDYPSNKPPAEFTVREWIRPWGEAGPFCKKL